MTTISSLPVSQYTSSLASGGTATSVARSSDGNLSRNAVSLASDASVVAILGGSGGSGTYSASGIFDTIATAGNSAASTTQATPADGQEQVDNGSEPADDAAAGSTAPASQGAPADLSASYASILKANPSAASMVAAYSMDQAVVSTFSTYA